MLRIVIETAVSSSSSFSSLFDLDPVTEQQHGQMAAPRQYSSQAEPHEFEGQDSLVPNGYAEAAEEARGLGPPRRGLRPPPATPRRLGTTITTATCGAQRRTLMKLMFLYLLLYLIRNEVEHCFLATQISNYSLTILA